MAADFINKIIHSNCLTGLQGLPDKSVHCCVTSPPYYGLRDYGIDEQIGLEETPEKYIESLVQVFTEVKRVLRDDGTLWLNIGDSYFGGGRGDMSTNKTNEKHLSIEAAKPKWTFSGYKPKDLIGIPWMLAFALRSSGWYLRQDIIWHKPNPMPESVTDRCTKAHEYIFLLSKSAKYYYDHEAIKENSVDPASYKPRSPRSEDKRAGDKFFATKVGGNANGMVYEERNKRSVWTVTTKPFSDAHFATFPEDLIVDCIKAGCPEGGIVLDPFMGAGTTALVARKLNRNYIGFELNADYIKIADKRLDKELGMFRDAV
jgi:DNA modification methylase